jgi:hypothetical protein
MDKKSIFKEFPGFESIYHLSDPLHDYAYRGKVPIEELKGLGLVAVFTGKIKPVFPIIVRYAMGGKLPGDVIWTTGVISPMISEKVKSIFENEGFRGWSTYPVEVFSKSGDYIHGYYGLSFTGHCGKIDYSKSKREWRPAPTPKGKPTEVYIGEYFDQLQWDGSDFFCPDNTLCKFVLEPVMQALIKAKIKNLRFTRLTEQETSVRMIALIEKKRI